MTAALRLIAWLAAAVAGIALLHHVSTVPESDMSASRVVPAIALAGGFPIYAGPTSGPIIDFMYGPVAAVAFLPAALATTPSQALAIAAILNAVAFFGPMAWLHCRVAGRLDVGFAAFVLFVLFVLRDAGLTFSALTIHADAPALGLGAVACGLLVTGMAPATTGRLAAVALAAVLAAWTKQTMAPLGLALLAVAWARDGRRAAARLAGWMVGFGALVSVVCLVAFDPGAMMFNMVTLPSRMPWYDEATSGRWATMGVVARLLARAAWPPALVVAGLAVASRRARWAALPATLLLAAALVLAPMALLGGVKVGGYLNTFSVTTYFVVAAATAGLAHAARAPLGAGRAARVALMSGLAILAALEATGPAGVRTLGATIMRLRAWGDNPHERAYAAARAHPGEIAFPWNPLAVLLAEHRLDNNEIGAWNRDLAHVPIDDALWRRHLPPHLRVLAHRPPTGAFVWLPSPSRRLPEFTTPAALAGLEGWTVLAPAVAVAPTLGLERAPHVAPAPPRS